MPYNAPSWARWTARSQDANSISHRAPLQLRIGAPFALGIRRDRVVFLRRYSAQPDRLPHQAGDAVGLHLLHDLGPIAIDRPHADVQPGRDSLTGESIGDQIEDLDLARRQSD